VRYLLDTHAALWGAEDDERLGAEAREALLGCSPGDVAICEITLLEIVTLAKKRRVQFEISLPEYLKRLQVLYPPVRIEPGAAARAMDLPLPDGDLFDRVIVAAAVEYQLTLITRDPQITQSRLVPTLW
jgi:PIN domain nuclease of toxin-antitoxin system